MKASNIIGINTRPFSPGSFAQTERLWKDDNGLQHVELHHHNTIRWRWKRLPDGTVTAQSNARCLNRLVNKLVYSSMLFAAIWNSASMPHMSLSDIDNLAVCCSKSFFVLFWYMGDVFPSLAFNMVPQQMSSPPSPQGVKVGTGQHDHASEGCAISTV